ncbi:MAG: lipopolysaccharide heptosyltransferase I [Betaproteobacteria bacterium HGW-Betaproteobacteria-22]|nr:MAG: lipopolysaccharide heptosyltransferase I [Betaproteobacteria bacterium HGW-Betaproteobacteria-22]
MQKLLIIKTSSLGDVIHNLPIIHDIHHHHPDIKIDWVVEEAFADIPKLHSGVNRVIPVAIRRWRKAIFNQATWVEISAAKQQVSSTQYDIVLDTQGLLKSGLLTMLSHGKKHGYNRGSAREPLASLFYDVKYQVSRKLHAVTRNRTLAALSLGYPVPKTLPCYGIMASATIDSVSSKPYIIGLHGTSRDSKLWPTEHWIEFGASLAKQNMQLVLPWASAAELERAQHIANRLSNATVLPKLGIAQLATVISQAQAAVGVDTGLSHLSVALGTPTVAIYTDTDPALTGVYAGAAAPAINLGNIHEIPSANDVAQSLQAIIKK